MNKCSSVTRGHGTRDSDIVMLCAKVPSESISSGFFSPKEILVVAALLSGLVFLAILAF